MKQAISYGHIIEIGHVPMPAFSGIRCMMMPFRTDDVDTVPFAKWRDTLHELCKWSTKGVGYLTIDEAFVPAGECHRRPGLHVDGHDNATWGGRPAPYGSAGMVLLASHFGCVGWDQPLPDEPGPEGDCEHIRPLLDPERYTIFRAGVAYACSPLMVHEAIPMRTGCPRQFVRISFPNDGDWHEGYTESPYGIEPTGRIMPARQEYMDYRK